VRGGIHGVRADPIDGPDELCRGGSVNLFRLKLRQGAADVAQVEVGQEWDDLAMLFGSIAQTGIFC
jgi:hypothetical protein